MGILQLLAKENYITYHKTLAKLLGVDEAILFGELCSMNNLYGNEFFCEQSKLMNDTCLSEYRVRNALKNLQKANLVYVVKKGLPAKNYYILDEKKLIDILECQSTSSIKFDTTGDDNFNSTSDSKFNSTFNKNTDIKNTDNKNTLSKKERKRETYDEIIENFSQGNKELESELKKYLQMRFTKQKRLSNVSLKESLNNLLKVSRNNQVDMIEIVNKAVRKEQLDFYPLSEKEKQPKIEQNTSYNVEEYEQYLKNWYNKGMLKEGEK